MAQQQKSLANYQSFAGNLSQKGRGVGKNGHSINEVSSECALENCAADMDRANEIFPAENEEEEN
ncbi:hypothetical protein T01_11286 [Trichinella spiralis]|uniref:Uncharacterized protein n=1 Tax=Trichinella spiralis TaxID=6334 RepID=A0A0V1BVX2_TRISP|nr:hypothetical protein T01_11321 [Trichinella spiralis]KRY41064.1 hypothetical protein T01_11286 [Trichinella spiralis]